MPPKSGITPQIEIWDRIHDHLGHSIIVHFVWRVKLSKMSEREWGFSNVKIPLVQIFKYYWRSNEDDKHKIKKKEEAAWKQAGIDGGVLLIAAQQNTHANIFS